MGKINTLSIDIESYSDVDLQKCGVYRYSQSPNFEILLFGVSVNGGEVMTCKNEGSLIAKVPTEKDSGLFFHQRSNSAWQS